MAQIWNNLVWAEVPQIGMFMHESTTIQDETVSFNFTDFTDA